MQVDMKVLLLLLLLLLLPVFGEECSLPSMESGAQEPQYGKNFLRTKQEEGL